MNLVLLRVEMIPGYAEAASTSFDLSSRVDGEGNPVYVYNGREAKGEANFMAGDWNHEQSNKRIEAFMAATHPEEQLSVNSDKTSDRKSFTNEDNVDSSRGKGKAGCKRKWAPQMEKFACGGCWKVRVVDWTDVRDVITAPRYQPAGKGFAVGSLTGICRFFEASVMFFARANGSSLELKGDFLIHGSKKPFGSRITGIRFCQEDSYKVRVTSEGSRLHIFGRTDAVFKYRGLSESGSQMSASFTLNQRHIILVGEDLRIYIWNYDGQAIESPGSKIIYAFLRYLGQADSAFLAVTALGPLSPASKTQEPKRFSLVNWFSKNSFVQDSAAIWSEEILPLENSSPEQWQPQHYQGNHSVEVVSATWVLVILTASLDGIIRTFHDYGLPLGI
ncbi:hypothetical protein Ancab_026785 [Ancistrocladus abbreviatus]